MWVHPGVLPRLLDDGRIRIGGQPPTPPADALSGGSRTVVYVSTDDVETVLRDFRLHDDPGGHLILISAPPQHFEEHPGGRRVPVPAALADLLDEGDPRAHDLAARHLGELRDAFTRTDGAPR
jgi:hypothetical protein